MRQCWHCLCRIFARLTRQLVNLIFKTCFFFRILFAIYLGSYKQSFLSTWATVFGPNQVPTGFLQNIILVVDPGTIMFGLMRVLKQRNLSTLSPMRAIWCMEYWADFISRNLIGNADWQCWSEKLWSIASCPPVHHLQIIITLLTPLPPPFTA